MKRIRRESIFNNVNVIVLSLLSLSTVVPLIHIVAKSLSGETYILAKEIWLWPKDFNFASYEYVLSYKQFYMSFWNSLIITVVGTAISMAVTVLAAFPLSRKNFPFKRGFMLFFVITMFFSGGLIPTYLVVKQLGLLNTLWSIMLPLALAPFNLILIRNYFLSLPEALEESAIMDGASNIRILTWIYLPLSLPTIATIAMFYAVGYWNSFFQAMMYITDRGLMPLQVFLMQIVTNSKTGDMTTGGVLSELTPESTTAAAIICVVFPILCVYPFIQKYFVKGVMLGAVKG
ncbi:Diacetylchitobiose uptake system permease protein DasC [Paenibacillus allorhizoplanae]|uniref:Diacetylchitobiose uptake system permease protein DasC n=1 Tax=Paenibacillus allorhizoplanae TaxID=2905648 RepID=A0ABM9CI72_9BACL|nr:carbohydrate ABC transporter permease [Paenibacillus allorhizoplanae]CAH1213290.1 Diacetylchitobiose uptake system permease protein DasC [Paenibacillus allorhizoplanae]